MPLIKSPVLTFAKLAANRANARLSTGPRTLAGKRRIVLNALKHGRYSRAFRANLVKPGADAELFDWIHARIVDCFGPRDARQRWQAERLAREIWCYAWLEQRAERLDRVEQARQTLGAQQAQEIHSTNRLAGRVIRVGCGRVRRRRATRLRCGAWRGLPGGGEGLRRSHDML